MILNIFLTNNIYYIYSYDIYPINVFSNIVVI